MEHFQIFEYMGCQQGIRAVVIGRAKEYFLTSKDKVYAVHQGIEKDEKAGFPVFNS